MERQTQKPNTYFDYSQWENTGNKAIDMVAACVGHYRAFDKPIKSISLHPRLYDLFRRGMEVLIKASGAEPDYELQKYEFDGVDIERGSYLMAGRDIYVDFYKPEKELN